MIFLLIILFLWIGGLFWFRPLPADLREVIPSRKESFKAIKATLWLGIWLIVLFFIMSEGSINEIDENWWVLFGINNLETFSWWWLVQVFSHIFIHFNWIHLLMNLSFLGLMSLYERVVGSKKFLLVFIFCGAVSSLSVLFTSEPMITGGASGALMGLATAYVLDKPKLSKIQFFISLIGVIIYFLATSFGQTTKNTIMEMEIDYLGHFIGILAGAVFVYFDRRMVEIKLNKF